MPRSTYQPLRTDEETLALLRRLAVHYPDAVIAGILNRQGRRSARGERFTASILGSLRTHGASRVTSHRPRRRRANWRRSRTPPVS